MRRPGIVGLLAFAVLTSACGGAPAPPPAPATRSADLDGLRAQARERLAQRDWAGAARACTEALALAPDDLALQYGLGVASAHLDRRDDAIAAFSWVAEHAPAGAEEARIARQWLAEAGVIPTATPAPRDATARSSPGADEPAARGSVTGRTEWALRGDVGRPMLQVLLTGDDPLTRGRRHRVRVRLNEPYTITGVVPGSYRLSAFVASFKLWETAVTVRGDRPTTVDLTPANSPAPPDILQPAS
jgi:hypothetical protein